MRNINYKVITQYWYGFTRFIVMHRNGKASVIVDVYDEKNSDGMRIYLWGLYVDVKCRGCGYGNHLLQCAEEIAKDFKIDHVSLEWELNTPVWVFDWYKRHGYEECVYAKHSILLKKELPLPCIT